MIAKPCPECKSYNTRQMDREHYGNQAYCLSCYNRFRSVAGKVETVSIKSQDRGLEKINQRLERIERSLKIAQKDLLEVSKRE